MGNDENLIDESIIGQTKFIDGKDKTEEEIEYIRLDEVYNWLKRVTKDFKFMVVLYSCGNHIDQEERTSKCTIKIVTCSSRNYSDVTTKVDVDSNPGNILDEGKLESLYAYLTSKLKQGVVYKFQEEFINLDLGNPKTVVSLKRLFVTCMPASYKRVPMIIFDIEGYSKTSQFDQFALKHELNNRLERTRNLLNTYNDKKVEIRLNKLSTGDGFYTWNYNKIINQDDCIKYMLMLMLITMAMWKVAQKEWRKNKLRAAFAIGDLYTIPYKGLGQYNIKEDFIPDAFGDLLNDLNRIISKARPDQILVKIFPRSASADIKQDESNNKSDFTLEERESLRVTEKFITYDLSDEMKRIFESLLVSIGKNGTDIQVLVDPTKILFTYDKHEKKHLFVNVCGSVIAFKTDTDDQRKCLIESVGLKTNPEYEENYLNVDEANFFDQ